MPIEAQRPVDSLWLRGLDAITHAWIVFPWALLCWLGSVIALRRWSGLPLALSLGVSAAAVTQGWRLVWRIGAKLDDALIARLLRLHVPDAPAWTLFPQKEQILQAKHLSRCLNRWGVNARSSGWEGFCCSWCWDALLALVCALLTVHAWWLGV